MMQRTKRRRAPLLAAALAITAAPAAADWLVTRDGARLETRGPWEVRRGTVVFTSTNGTLSSMSVRDVDLDKSAELTAEKRTPPPAPASAGPTGSVISIGPDDVPRARPARAAADSPAPSASEEGDEEATGEAATGEEATGEEATGRPAAFADRLVVTGWTKNEPSWLDGVELVGQITNRSESTAADLALTVKIFDQEGRPLATERAFLESRSLLGGQSLDFRIPFEGVADFATVEFDVTATEVILGVGAIDAFDSKLAGEEGATTGDTGG